MLRKEQSTNAYLKLNRVNAFSGLCKKLTFPMVTACEVAMKPSVGMGLTDSITGCPATYSKSIAAPAKMNATILSKD